MATLIEHLPVKEVNRVRPLMKMIFVHELVKAGAQKIRAADVCFIQRSKKEENEKRPLNLLA